MTGLFLLIIVILVVFFLKGSSNAGSTIGDYAPAYDMTSIDKAMKDADEYRKDPDKYDISFEWSTNAFGTMFLHCYYRSHSLDNEIEKVNKYWEENHD